MSLTVNRDFDDIFGPAPRNTKSKTNLPVRNRPDLASESDLADFWGVSNRQIRKLLSDVVIEKTDSGLYEVSDCTKRYIKHLIERARHKTNPEITEERLRLLKEQADQVELKNQQKRGEMVPASQVELEWADILRTVRAGLLAVPGRVGVRLSLSPSMLSEIDNEIRTVLRELGE